MRQVFQRIDVDGDGQLTAAELHRAATSERRRGRGWWAAALVLALLGPGLRPVPLLLR